MNVPHRSPDGVVGREPYLHNCLRHFVKADFWEVPMFPGNFVLEEVPDDAAFVHASRERGQDVLARRAVVLRRQRRRDLQRRGRGAP